jgi:hypothetical protein
MRRIVEDYQAKLRPPDERGRGRGKIEWERHADGSEVLCARFRKLNLPDGTRVSVRLDGTVLGHARVDCGAGRIAFESWRGQAVPKAVAGQVGEIADGHAVLLRGIFEVD